MRIQIDQYSYMDFSSNKLSKLESTISMSGTLTGRIAIFFTHIGMRYIIKIYIPYEN